MKPHVADGDLIAWEFQEAFETPGVEPQKPLDSHSLLEATFSSGHGSFAKVADFLHRNEPTYLASSRAFQLLETLVKEAFVGGQKEATAVVSSEHNNIEEISLNVRDRVLLLWAIIRNPADLVDKVLRFIAFSTKKTVLALPSPAGEGSGNEWYTAAHHFDCLLAASNSGELTNSVQMELYKLSDIMSELIPYFKAFRAVLARDIIADRERAPSSKTANLLVPLVTSGGLLRALGRNKGDAFLDKPDNFSLIHYLDIVFNSNAGHYTTRENFSL